MGKINSITKKKSETSKLTQNKSAVSGMSFPSSFGKIFEIIVWVIATVVLLSTIFLHFKLHKIEIGTAGNFPFPSLSDISQNLLLLFKHFEGGYTRTITGYLIFILISFTFLAIGRWASSYLFLNVKKESINKISGFEELSIDYLIGSLVVSLLWYGLGLIGFLNTPIAVTLLVIGSISFFLQLINSNPKYKMKSEIKDTFLILPNTELRITYAFLGSVVLLWLLFFSTTSLYVPQQGDTLITHITLPSYYINAGKIIFNPNNFHSYFPENTEMLVMWGLLLKSEVAATLLMWGFYTVWACLIWGFIKRYSDPLIATLVTLVFISIPTISNAAMTIKNDISVSFFIFAHFYALSECIKNRQDHPKLSKRWALLAGIIGGGAIGHKLTALPVVGITALFIVAYNIYQRKKPNHSSISYVYLIGIIGLVLPWFIRTFLETGNPIFPFMSSLFGSTNNDFYYSDIENKFYLNSGIQTLLDYLRLALWGETNQGMPSWGPSLFFSAISLPILAMKSQTNFRISISIALLSYLALLSSNEIRFHMGLLSFLMIVPFALAIGYLFQIRNNLRTRFLIIGIVALCAFVPISNAFYIAKSSFTIFVSGNNIGNIQSKEPIVDNMRWVTHIINTRTRPDEKILFAGIHYAYGLKRRFWYSSGFDKELIGQLAETSKNSIELLNRIRNMGVSHIVISRKFIEEFQNHHLPEIKISNTDLQKIGSLINEHMVPRLTSPDKNLIWYSLKNSNLIPVKLNSIDARKFPIMFRETVNSVWRDGNRDYALNLMKEAKDVPMSSINKWSILSLLGYYYSELGDIAEAEKTFLKGIETEPYRPEPYIILAEFYEINKNQDDVIKPIINNAIKHGGLRLLENNGLLSKYLSGR